MKLPRTVRDGERIGLFSPWTSFPVERQDLHSILHIEATSYSFAALRAEP